MTPEAILSLLVARDPIAAGLAVAPLTARVVTWSRQPAPADWLVDGEEEQPVELHRAAHAAGRPSEAAVCYGAGIPPEAVAERLLALAALSRETGMLRAVCPVPVRGTAERPGSWGVEDLTVIAAARLACPDVPWIRPHWRRLGAGACQVATAFGANDWILPDGERVDPALLAAGTGRQAVER
jgi:2-iminoacetate synthase ThiH